MKKISVFNPSISLIDAYSVFRSTYKGEISGTAPIVNTFEKNFARFCSRKYGIALSNGSVALDLVFASLGLNEGDEVILPSFTIISCLAAILRCKAVPVFVDVNESSWNLTAASIEKAISPKTKAVLIVHLYGLPAEAKAIEELCVRRGLALIEDAAEAHGMRIGSRIAGSFGDASTFSFYANKHVTSGEGGMVVTNNKELFQKIGNMRNLGFDPKKRFVHNELFWNYRIGGLAAALGNSQLKKISKTISKKKNQAHYYKQLLKPLMHELSIQAEKWKEVENNYWVFGIVLNDSYSRDQVMERLAQVNIETRPFFWPLHLQPVLSKYEYRCVGSLSVSEKLGKLGMYLPMGQGISKSMQRVVVKELTKILIESQGK